MLLTGTYERMLDDKQRFALPKRLREAFTSEPSLVLTPGTDGSLALFTQTAFAALASRLEARSPAGQDVRAFSRLLYAQSHCVEADSQGRIRVPGELLLLAGLDRDLVLIGVGDRIEIWNKSRWEAYLAALQPKYDQLAETAFGDSSSQGAQDVAVFATNRPAQPR